MQRRCVHDVPHTLPLSLQALAVDMHQLCTWCTPFRKRASTLYSPLHSSSMFESVGIIRSHRWPVCLDRRYCALTRIHSATWQRNTAATSAEIQGGIWLFADRDPPACVMSKEANPSIPCQHNLRYLCRLVLSAWCVGNTLQEGQNPSYTLRGSIVNKSWFTYWSRFCYGGQVSRMWCFQAVSVGMVVA